MTGSSPTNAPGSCLGRTCLKWRADGELTARDLSLVLDRLALVEPLTNGGFARERIQIQIRRLGRLQPEVLHDREPEPLHQLRVSLRRLRTVLLQFGPALVLPACVKERRLATVARRTSLCRDLDVLRLRLREQLLPRLPLQEQHRLDGALDRLVQDRRQAFETLVEALQSPRYLRLLARLHKWQKQPRFTPLGLQPLLPWLVDWQAPFTAGLFLHPGWQEQDPAAEALHGLRKRIKAVRYALETIEPWCEATLHDWIAELRGAQDDLGNLHDLQILQRTLADTLKPRQWAALPSLQAELESQQRQHWQQWQERAQRLCCQSHRHAIQRQLLELGRTPLPAAPAAPGATTA